MGTAWSAYVVPAALRDAVFESCKTVFGEVFGIEDSVLVVEAAGDQLWFVVEVQGARYTELAGDHDLDAGPPLSRLLGARVLSMYGTSNTDSCDVAAYEGGRCVDRIDTDFSSLSRLRRFRCDLAALRQWAEFGLSGAEPSGVRLPLCGDGQPEPRQRARLAVSAATTPQARAVALDLVVTLVADGELPALDAAEHCLTLGEAERARSLVTEVQPTTYAEKSAFVALCLRLDVPELASGLAGDDQLGTQLRLRLLDALGQPDPLRRERLAKDLNLAGSALNVARLASARHHPDPAERVRLLDASAPDPVQFPAMALLVRYLVAMERLLLGEAVADDLLVELDATGLAPFAAHAETLRSLTDAEPLDVLRSRLEAATDDATRDYARADLALALTEAGDDSASQYLEAAYLALGHASPYRAPLEAALTSLGLF